MTDRKQDVSSVRMIASRAFGLVRLSAISSKLKHNVEYGKEHIPHYTDKVIEKRRIPF